MGPRKLRRVADAIRGKSVKEALVLLQFAGVFAAAPMNKLLRSAVANAGNNHDMNTDDLYVTSVTVDGGPGGRFTKRLDPRAQGRANFKRKRLSHVTIVVGDERPAKQRRAPVVAVEKPAATSGDTPAKQHAPRKRPAGASKGPSRKSAAKKTPARKKATKK